MEFRSSFFPSFLVGRFAAAACESVINHPFGRGVVAARRLWRRRNRKWRERSRRRRRLRGRRFVVVIRRRTPTQILLGLTLRGRNDFVAAKRAIPPRFSAAAAATADEAKPRQGKLSPLLLLFDGRVAAVFDGRRGTRLLRSDGLASVERRIGTSESSKALTRRRPMRFGRR